MKTYSSLPGREKKDIIACNICGSREYRSFLRGENYHYVRCNQCSLVYQNPAPVFSDLKNRYSQEYFQYELTNEENFFNLMKLGLKDIHFSKILPSSLKNKNFLDIGCATGMLLAHMQNQGWQVKGVDLCKESIEYGRKKRKLDLFAGTLAEANFKNGYFSVIHFSHLIEHVPDPRNFLEEVRRIMTPGGLAIITTPNVKGLQAGIFKQKWRSAIADHLFLFSKATLKRILIETGFTIKKIVTWGGLAIGTVPWFIKKPMDCLAKKMGFGDVMLFLVEKT